QICNHNIKASKAIMLKTKPATLKGSKMKCIKYTKPSVNDLKEFRKNAKVKTIHKVTQMLIRIVEEFYYKIEYEGKIKEIYYKTVLEDQLSKFIYAMKRKNGKKYHATSIRNCLTAIW
ncbi:24250_t:CDS:2, partial [Cetraspora pellucida]